MKEGCKFIEVGWGDNFVYDIRCETHGSETKECIEELQKRANLIAHDCDKNTEMVNELCKITYNLVLYYRLWSEDNLISEQEYKRYADHYVKRYNKLLGFPGDE